MNSVTPDTRTWKECPLARKHSLIDLMREKNLTTSGLAAGSGVSAPTARKAVKGSDTSRVNTSSAQNIAGSFGLKVSDINWPGGLSNRGRTAGPSGS